MMLYCLTHIITCGQENFSDDIYRIMKHNYIVVFICSVPKIHSEENEYFCDGLN